MLPRGRYHVAQSCPHVCETQLHPATPVISYRCPFVSYTRPASSKASKLLDAQRLISHARAARVSYIMTPRHPPDSPSFPRPTSTSKNGIAYNEQNETRLRQERLRQLQQEVQQHAEHVKALQIEYGTTENGHDPADEPDEECRAAKSSALPAFCI